MAREHLAARDNWQREGNERGAAGERQVHEVLEAHFQDTDFTITKSPQDLRGVYGTRVDKRGREHSHGIVPDSVISSNTTGRKVYIEVKRQRNAGNAHERACKYMMPGLLNSARATSGQPTSVVPFWWIFTEGLATDPSYRQAITHWFLGMEAHFLLWEDLSDPQPVQSHFDHHITPLLSS